LIGFVCWATGSLAQLSETRVALVIGNGDYNVVARLFNPPRDADIVAQTLKSLGFKTVQTQNDLGFDAMRRVLRDFAAEAEKADWAVIYYAGHAIEVDGTNYLIPVDARLRSDRDVQFEAVSLDQMLASIEGARKLRLVILDACRDNPFLNRMTRTSASRSIGRGLARVEPEGGTLVAYAAKAGQIAYDGNGQNSPFVTALIKRLMEPGLEINMLFRAVRDDVLAATERMQEPFVYGSLPSEPFYFAPTASLAPPSLGASDPAARLPGGPAPPKVRPTPPGSAEKSPETATPPRASVPALTIKPALPNRRLSPQIRGAQSAPRKNVAAEQMEPSSKPRPRSARPATAVPSRNCFNFGGRSFCE